MQRHALSSRDRALSLAAVLLVHAAVVLAVLNGSGVKLAPREELNSISTFDVVPEEPPPPVVEQVQEEPAPEEEGEASPPNLESQATPVVAPPPAVDLLRPNPVVASETPRDGSDPTQGAAPVPGPGTGSGGVGTGTGSGGSGAGGGGGGTGQAPRGPSVIQSTTLTGRDYPREVIRAWPRRSPVFVAVRVQLDGQATECKVNRSSGDPTVDQWTCRLVEERVRFRPAINEQGQPYVAWYGYVQTPVNF